MTTVSALIDRLYRTILEPPDFQPHMGFLSSAMTTASTTVTFDGFSLPEDEQFLALGRLIEIDSELMRVSSYEPTSKTATLHTTGGRNKEGTTLATHDAGAVVKIGAPWSRLSVFEAIRDNIISLYPRLYTVRTSFVSHVGGGGYPINDELAAEVERAVPDGDFGMTNIHGRFVDQHSFTGSRAFVTTSGHYGNLWLTYRRRFDVADAETDTLSNLGVESVWEWMILVGAAADLLIGRDIPQAQQDFIGSQIEAETKPPGTEQSIAARLRQYRDYLLDGFAAEMDAEYQPRVVMRNPFGEITGGVQ